MKEKEDDIVYQFKKQPTVIDAAIHLIPQLTALAEEEIRDFLESDESIETVSLTDFLMICQRHAASSKQIGDLALEFSRAFLPIDISTVEKSKDEIPSKKR